MNTSRVRMLARWIGALFALLALVPAAADPPPHAEEEPLSLNFQDIDVRAALRIIANAADFNLVASEAVSGRVTLRLEEVAWEQALELVLQVAGLDQRRLGDVVYVAPAAEIAAAEQFRLQAEQQTAALAPVRTEHIRIGYARAAGPLVPVPRRRPLGRGASRPRPRHDRRAHQRHTLHGDPRRRLRISGASSRPLTYRFAKCSSSPESSPSTATCRSSSEFVGVAAASKTVTTGHCVSVAHCRPWGSCRTPLPTRPASARYRVPTIWWLTWAC